MALSEKQVNWLKKLNSFVVSNYEYLTPDTKEKITQEELINYEFVDMIGWKGKTERLFTNASNSNDRYMFDSHVSMASEISSMYYLSVVRGGLDGCADIKNALDLYSTCVKEVPGFKFEDGTGKVTIERRNKEGVFEEKEVTFSLRNDTERWVKDIASYSPKAVRSKEENELNKLSINELIKEAKKHYGVVKHAVYKVDGEVIAAGNKFVGNLKSENGYITVAEAKRIVDSMDSMKKAGMDVSAGFDPEKFKQFDEGIRKIAAYDPFRLVLTEPNISLIHTDIIINFERGKKFDKLMESGEKFIGSDGKELTPFKIFEEKAVLSKEEKDKIMHMSDKEAMEIIGEMPIQEKQKFELRMCGVADEKFDGKTVSEAQEMLKEKYRESKTALAPKEIKEYAVKVGLCKDSDVYTIANWKNDSKNVPPMDVIKDMCFEYNLEKDLEYRLSAKQKEAEKKGITGEITLSHNDYVLTLSKHFETVDSRMHGPVQPYQKDCRAVQECVLKRERIDFQKAEQLYLRHCVSDKLLGYSQATYLYEQIKKSEKTVGVTDLGIRDYEGTYKILMKPDVPLSERREWAAKVMDKLTAGLEAKLVREIISAKAPSKDVLQDSNKKYEKCCQFAAQKIAIGNKSEGKVDISGEALKQATSFENIGKVITEAYNMATCKTPGDVYKLADALNHTMPGMISDINASSSDFKAKSGKERRTVIIKEIARCIPEVNINEKGRVEVSRSGDSLSASKSNSVDTSKNIKGKHSNRNAHTM